MEWLKKIRPLPEGYFIIDSDESPHDGDAEDGRYGLYHGDPPSKAEFLGCSHDMSYCVDFAWTHAVDKN